MWGNSHEYSNKIVVGKSAAKPDYSGTFTEHNGNLDYGSGRCARSRSVRPLIINVICSRWRGDGISAVAKDNKGVSQHTQIPLIFAFVSALIIY